MRAFNIIFLDVFTGKTCSICGKKNSCVCLSTRLFYSLKYCYGRMLLVIFIFFNADVDAYLLTYIYI